ncbi:hypothetical protein NL355_27895, partial [Klebsiella pneumoniae]|nr:hypothetical protein [Klebsiella pneumoniae]
MYTFTQGQLQLNLGMKTVHLAFHPLHSDFPGQSSQFFDTQHEVTVRRKAVMQTPYSVADYLLDRLAGCG